MRAMRYRAPVWSSERDKLIFNRWGEPIALGGWPDLARRLMQFGPWSGDKERNPPPLWSPVEMAEGKRKSVAADVAWVHCLVMDYDGGTTIEQAMSRWEPWEYVLHTSWSHSPEHHKVRVVLPLLEPVDAAIWREVYTETLSWDAERSGLSEEDAATAGLRADPACKDPSRMYYVPALGVSGDAAAHTAVWHGADDSDDARPWLDLHDMIQRAERAQKRREAEKRARREAADRRARDRVATGPEAEEEIKRRLLEDYRARATLGSMVGGEEWRVGKDTMYRHIPCPGCGQASVWFVVEPSKMFRARCNHRETCEWEGHLWELAAMHGVRLT